MTGEHRLAEIVTALEREGLTCLVMGGHAVRFYGLSRYTVDYDLHLAAEGWDDLADRLARTGVSRGTPPVEGDSWRPGAFRRFQIGRLEDGREEWLEFWRHNHLLGPFPDLFARRETGEYGGRPLAFLSLPDLIRSKETQRAADWQDVLVLEDFLDARHLARVRTGRMSPAVAAASIRSRSGFDSFYHAGILGDPGLIAQALPMCQVSMTVAYLLPFVPQAPLPVTRPGIEPIVVAKLRRIAPATEIHLALVEAVRRQYRTVRQAEDRADKEAIRKAQQG